MCVCECVSFWHSGLMTRVGAASLGVCPADPPRSAAPSASPAPYYPGPHKNSPFHYSSTSPEATRSPASLPRLRIRLLSYTCPIAPPHLRSANYRSNMAFCKSQILCLNPEWKDTMRRGESVSQRMKKKNGRKIGTLENFQLWKRANLVWPASVIHADSAPLCSHLGSFKLVMLMSCTGM